MEVADYDVTGAVVLFSLAYKMHFFKWTPVANLPMRIGMCAVADV
jgi:hypothetical protein